MKRKIAVIVLAVVCSLALAVGLTACSNRNDNTPTHTHNYAWSDNGDGTHNGHCSVAGCDKPDVKNETHTWGTDNKCEKCKAVKPNGESHTHDYKLKHDEKAHWWQCDVAGCDNKIKDKSAHDASGANGACSVCGYKNGTEDPPAPPEHEHTYSDDWTSAGAEGHYRLANCEHTGEHTEIVPHTYDDAEDTTCNDCGYVREIIVYPHDHIWSQAWKSNQTHHWHICLGCKEKNNYATHNWNIGVVTQPATEESAGIKTYTCITCSATKTENIAKLSHTHSWDTTVWKKDEWYHWHTCAKCNDKGYYEAHDFTGGNCKCGEKKPSEGLEYSLNSGTYAVTGIGTCQDTELVIPAMYKEKPVTGIGYEAFKNNSSITSITIPATVTKIDNSAFSNCSSLKSISIDMDNPNYASQDGILYNKAKTSIVYVPKAIESVTTIPNSLKNIGDSAFYDCNKLTSITLPNSITSIGSHAFDGCSELTSITLPNSVTSIGNGAFSNCSSLMRITIPNSVTSIGDWAFYNCTSLTSITIPDSVTSIGGNSFSGCSIETATIPAIACASIKNSELKTVVITSGTSIEGDAFRSCGSLTNITILNGVTSIERRAFSGCSSLRSIIIPNSITSIGEDAFYGCNSLQYNEYDNAYYLGNDTNKYMALIKAKNTSITSCTMHENIKLIAANAFYNCDKLRNITIPNSVTSIGRGAFKYPLYNEYGNAYYLGNGTNKYMALIKAKDTSITTCTVHENTKFICDSAFSSCNNLTCITIPSSITSIGVSAFYNCSGLFEIKYAGDIKDWCSINGLYNLMSYGKSDKKLYINETEITGNLVIPSGITTIPSYAFRGCSGLTGITIPNSVTSIGKGAFSYCSGLKSITIPNSVTSIGESVFSDCSSLTSITIPSSVTSIEKGAFSYCSGLKSITIPNSVTSIEKGAFSYCNNLTSITLPFVGASRDATKATYFGYIFGADSYENISQIPKSLTTVTLTDSKRIADNAFYWCSGLTNVTIPNSVTSIGDLAFYDCSSLASIIIQDSGTSIESSAFHGCSSLTNIYLSDSATILDGEMLFGDAHSLESITIPARAISHIPRASYLNNLTTVTILSGAIKNDAFYNCSSLTSVTMCDGVTSIGDNAFRNCNGLTSIEIPVSVTNIGDYAFDGCSGLTNIGIPNSVINIGKYAFRNCSSLSTVEIADGVTNIGEAAFSGCSSLIFMTLPFVGGGLGMIDKECRYSFGYIFGRTKYTGSYVVKQNSYNLASYSTYYIPESLKTVTISGGSILYSSFTDCKGLTSIILPPSLTNIGYKTFQGCSSLTSIEIPCGVTVIGDQAFFGCNALTTIDIPNGVTSIGESVFEKCGALTDISIPDSVETVGYRAFYACNELNYTEYDNALYLGNAKNPYLISAQAKDSRITSCIIHKRTKIIMYSAFQSCKDLTSLTVPNGITSIGRAVYGGCSSLKSIEIPDSVTNIADAIFYSTDKFLYNEYDNALYLGNESNKYIVLIKAKDTSITSCTINENTKFIYGSAFYNCNKLTSITIPNGVTSIGGEAFSGCSSLTSINYTGDIENWCKINGLRRLMSSGRTLYFDGKEITGELIVPDGVTFIPSYAFYNCNKLTSITIPNSVTSIGGSAFYGCSGLTSITIPDSVTSIDSGAFYGCSGLTSITIPDSVISIGSSAFYGCPIENAAIPAFAIPYIKNSSLKTVIITSGTGIEEGAFGGCRSLTSITIPNSVISIGDQAFSGCSSLTSITIPNSVTSIGDQAFSGCSSLTSITIPSSVTSIGDSAFTNCYALVNITFNGSKSQWKAFKKYKNSYSNTGNYTIHCSDGTLYE